MVFGDTYPSVIFGNLIMNGPEKTLTKEMVFRQSRFNLMIKTLCTLLLVAFWCPCASLAKDASPQVSEQESGYNLAIERSYAELRTTHAKSGLVKSSLPELNTAVNTSIITGDNGSAILQLALNIPLMETAVDSALVMHFFNYLLDQEAIPVAEQLLSAAERSGDTYALSRMHYFLGKHFYQKAQWAVAQYYLSKIEIKAALTKEQSDYATIIFGVTLQHQKKHREALKYYDTIEPKSVYYGFSQLNKAVVYIRQGWWTDARMAIEKALEQKAAGNTEEFANRLQLVLGYNQLQHEFYRNARESFRKITLDSQYADRALLGIGLCALNQGDYVGAINAFGILKGKTETNISIAESYLLYAFTHEQMSQPQIASAMYEEAIAYYDRKLRETDATLALLRTGGPITGDMKTPIGEHQTVTPQYLSIRSKLLNYLATQVSQKRNKALISEAQRDLQAETRNAAITAFEAEKNILVSYLSQAQFGQAKLFDNIQQMP